MVADESSGSGDTTQRLTWAAQLATIVSGIVTTATSIATIVTDSVTQISLVVSVMITVVCGLHLLTEWIRQYNLVE